MKYHKETAPCGKCGKPIRFPASGLNYGKIAKVMGATVYHPGCEPARAGALRALAQSQGMRLKSR
jgi:hypothetical protein